MENANVCQFCETGGRESPLMTAIRYSHVQCLNELIAAGADVNEGTDDHTPVTLALRPRGIEADEQCLDLLVNAGSDLDSPRFATGDTPLIYVCRDDIKVKILIRKGTDVNAKNRDGSTALMRAAVDGIHRSVKLLLEAGADVNSQNSYGQSPLHAVAFGSIVYRPPCNQCKAILCRNKETDQCVDLLLSAGADVNVRNVYGLTPLIAAAWICNVKCLDFLIRSGSDVNAADNDGVTALMEAAGLGVFTLYRVCPPNAIIIAKNALTCCKLLLKAGAHINVVSFANFTARDLNIDNSTKVSEDMQYLYHEIQRLLYAAGEYQWVQTNPAVYLNQVPQSLKDICRSSVRHHLLCLDQHCDLFRRIPLLRLPNVIKAYLLFNTSLDIDED